MAKNKRREPEVIREWKLKAVPVKTNVGLQVTDLNCKLVKSYGSRDERTMFEKIILGYKDYWYYIDVEPVNPIRENRDKDFLPPFSEEGNDATYSFSLGLGVVRRNNEPDISEEACNLRILRYLDGFDPDKRRKKSTKGKRKEKWTNKTLWHKTFNNYNECCGMFTAIYPFSGDFLSGHTDIVAFDVVNDDEDGFGFNFALFGVHFYFRSKTLQKLLLRRFVKHRPKWNKEEMTWIEFHTLLKKWQKEHKIEYFLDSDFHIEFGINRAYGFYFQKEVDHSTKGKVYFNPWRNKLWRLI